jgi:hypothetical protein
MGHFLGFFEWVLTFLTPQCSIICFAREKNNNIPEFHNQRYINIYYVPLAYILHLLDSYIFSKRICFHGKFGIQRDSMKLTIPRDC